MLDELDVAEQKKKHPTGVSDEPIDLVPYWQTIEILWSVVRSVNRWNHALPGRDASEKYEQLQDAMSVLPSMR